MNINVRFFYYDEESGNDDESDNFVECDANTFDEKYQQKGWVVDYGRNTMFENGIDQICLSTHPEW